MFYDNFKCLCDKNGISEKKAGIEMGFSNSVTQKWKKGSVPNGATLKKISEYFNVTVSDLIGETSKVVNMSALDIEFQNIIAGMTDDEKMMALDMIKTIKAHRK